MRRPAVRQFVAVDRSNYNIPQSQLGRCFSHLLRLSLERLEREPAAGFDRAKSTASRAGIAKDHERGCPSCKTFISVGTSSLFTNRMKSTAPEDLLHTVVGFGMTPRFAQPFGQARSGFGQSFNLNECSDHQARSP